MARLTILLSAFFILIICQSLHGQNPPAAARPDLRPGDKLWDRGQRRDAEFVEFTPVGLIKVRFEDDSQVAFRPQNVRWAKGINPRAPAPNAPAGNAAGPNPANAKLPPPGILPLSKRRWSDASGKFSVDAEFIGMSGNEVELKKTDGKIIKIPLDKLASADQRIAQQLQEAAPNPFEANVAGSTGTTSIAKVIWQNIKPSAIVVASIPSHDLPEQLPAIPWSGQAEIAAPAPPKLASTSYSIPDLNERLLVMADSARNWVWIYQLNHGSAYEHGHVNRLDLVNGVALPVIHFAEFNRPLTVDPAGRILVTATKYGQINFWEIGDQELIGKRALMFTKNSPAPGDPAEPIEATEKWRADFLDAEHLLLRGPGCIVIHVPTYRVLRRYDLRNTSLSLLSPSRKQLAFSRADGIYLADAFTGKLLGKFDDPEPESKFARFNSFLRVVFSADGQHLIQPSSESLHYLDLTTGKVAKSQYMAPFYRSGDVALGGHGHLIFDGRYAVDPEIGWRTSSLRLPFEENWSHAGQQWYLSRNRAEKVLEVQHCEFPSAAAVAKARSHKLEDFNVLKPGALAMVQFKVTLDAAAEQQVSNALAARLKFLGAALAPDGVPGTHVIVVQVLPRGTGQVYRMFMTDLSVDTVYWDVATPPSPAGAVSAEIFCLLAERIPKRLIRYPNNDAVVSEKLTPAGLSAE